jgi:hypothetical protein
MNSNSITDETSDKESVRRTALSVAALAGAALVTPGRPGWLPSPVPPALELSWSQENETAQWVSLPLRLPGYAIGFSLGFRDSVPDISLEFEKLKKTWKSEKRAFSSTSDYAVHPAYQGIIGLGESALPLILAELRRERDSWFWALAAISRENPVPPESRGNLEKMSEAWLAWGRVKGYIS